MSSETDHPRQRTVAELLAEHGAGGAATGRRRRRRESDDEPVNGGAAPPVNGSAPPQAAPRQTNGGAAPTLSGAGLFSGGPPQGGAPLTGNGIAPAAWAFPPSGPDRSVLREPVPQEVAPEVAPRNYVPEPDVPRAAPPRRGRDIPTDHLPRYRDDRTGMLDPGLTGPITQQPVPAQPLPQQPLPQQPLPQQPLDEPTIDPDDGGPATMVGAAPVGAEAWHRSRTRSSSDEDGGPATQAAVMPDFDDAPAGIDDDQPRRRLGRSSGEPSPGQAWAAVVAQWIVGAVGGAALWVGFRFLWRELPVVALAAAVLVTVGLVLIVRALLRNTDLRTTVFAVLVGLLLTVSPAILVLLGR